MHWLDQFAGKLVVPRRKRLRFFHDGWGDPALLEEYRTVVRTPVERYDLALAWKSPVVGRRALTQDASFTARSRHLPPASRHGHVRLIIPPGVCRRVVLLMAAWNDHGYDTRSQLALRLADQGIATLMLDNPYFGQRKPFDYEVHPIATVVDFAVMGRAAIEEGRALLQHLGENGLPGRDGDELVLGVAGYSMGGNITAFLSTAAPFPVASAPLAASYSPGPVLCGGVIHGAIDWDALGGEAAAEGPLAEFLGNISVLNYAPPPHTAAAVMVAGRHDGFVPPETSRALHRHWPGAELRWVEEGHASLLLWRKPTLVRAIVDSFDRFEEWSA